MKNLISNKLILALTLVLGTFFYSCTEDSIIDPGVDNREKFLGTWTVEESCIRLNYEVAIEADSTDDKRVLLYNFAFMGQEFDPAYGFVSGGTVNLPQQSIGDGWEIKGSGTLQSDNTIIWTYYIEIGANGSNCQANFQH